MTWQQAHDLLRTDWTEVDPRNRPRPREAVASIACGLTANTNLPSQGVKEGQPCPEMFFLEIGQLLHHEETHGIPLPPLFRHYDPIYPPSSTPHHIKDRAS